MDENGNEVVQQDSATTTGIIVIAAVSCVVLTSLIWVIIIYQTRRRTSASALSNAYHVANKHTTTPVHINCPGRMFDLNYINDVIDHWSLEYIKMYIATF